MRVAIDFSCFDRLPGTGQHRYVVDLVHGLAEVAPDSHFMVIGSTKNPVPEIAHLMEAPGTQWSYRQLEPSKGRGAYYLDRIRLSLLLRKERITIFHASHTFVPVFPSCAVVITIHDLMFELFDEYREALHTRPYRLYKESVQKMCTRAIAISQQTANDLQRLWSVDSEKIDVVYHGTRLDFLADEVGSGASKEEEIVISAPYNLEPRKNLGTLLEALAQIKDNWPGLKLLLFGRAAITLAREKLFEQQVERLNLKGSVVLTGYLEDEALRQLYRRSRLFVFPSLYEGFGLPLLEAMACGVCVVARNASAMAEVVGQAGLLVAMDDAVSLAASIDSALAKPELCRSLGLAAQARAAEFTVRRMAEKTLDSYYRAAGKISPATRVRAIRQAVQAGVRSQ